VIARCCAVLSGPRQATLVELWTSYTVIIKRDEKILQHKVNEVIKKLEFWFQKNNLMIKIGKTVAMSYHTKQSRFPMIPKFTYRNTDIAYKYNTKIYLYLNYRRG
jgi:hypothetical protein